MDSRWKRSDSNPVFKWKLGTKAEIRMSAEQRTAGSQPKSCFLVSPFVFPLEDLGGGRTHSFSLQQPFCLPNLTFPFKVSEAALSFLKGRGYNNKLCLYTTANIPANKSPRTYNWAARRLQSH